MDQPAALTTTRSGPPGIPATPPHEPRLTATLGYLCRQVEDGNPTVLRDVHLPDFLRDEARMGLETYQRLILAAPAQRILDWVAGVNRGLGNPLRKEAFAGWSTEVVGVLAGLPVAVFHAGTRAEAGRAFTFQPSAAELFALLNVHARPLKAKAAALKRLLATAPPKLEKEQLSDEQRDEIATDFHHRVHAAIAEAKPEVSEPTPMGDYVSKVVSRAVLRAQYERLAASTDETTATLARSRLHILGVDVPPLPAAAPPPPDDDEIPWDDNRGTGP